MLERQKIFEERLRILLPETYRVFDSGVQPRSMGSAGLQYGPDSKVQWDKMWASFCHLAMAGGPPHRGRLLEPFRGTSADAEDEAKMLEASAEICRGIGLVTGLCAEPAATPGWLRMYCTSAAMAGWVARAIVMENVTAVAKGLSVFLPTGPDFRVEKEVKNVITSIAKTCHYWQDHMPETQHEAIAELLASMDREAPLLQPAMRPIDVPQSLHEQVVQRIHNETLWQGISTYRDWVGVDCAQVTTAIWLMRALAVGNCDARREETVVFLPLNPEVDVDGERAVSAVTEAVSLACRYGVQRTGPEAQTSQSLPEVRLAGAS